MCQTGSTAGAGSGDFHHYRSLRRKELFRLKRMDSQARKQQLDEEWKLLQEERKTKAEQKTSKKRTKREKQKKRKNQKNKKQKVEPSKRGAEDPEDSETVGDQEKTKQEVAGQT